MIAYQEAVDRLFALGHELARTSGHKFDLEFVRVLLAALGHPEQRYPAVLVAGTNGKGSTAATLASILQAAGHRTALYTSPHLRRINERIRVNGQEIAEEDFSAAYERVETAAQRLLAEGKLPWHPSFFEMLTAMAFLHFAQPPVDLAVLEVGMGGRLDATNVVDPLLSIITDISLDHQKFLGNSVEEIAREKTGIIHPGGTVVTLPQHTPADEVIAQRALACRARVVSALSFLPPDPAERAYSLEIMGQPITVDSPLAGTHQRRNLALAIAAAEQLAARNIRISPQDIATGIRQTCWPGRFQIVPADPRRGRPEIVLDVAHNPAGAGALRDALSARYGKSPERPLFFVFGALRDKAIGEIAAILFPLATRLVITRAANPRSASPEDILALARPLLADAETREPVGAAIESACNAAGPNGIVVITGSIFVVGEAMTVLFPR